MHEISNHNNATTPFLISFYCFKMSLSFVHFLIYRPLYRKVTDKFPDIELELFHGIHLFPRIIYPIIKFKKRY